MPGTMFRTQGNSHPGGLNPKTFGVGNKRGSCIAMIAIVKAAVRMAVHAENLLIMLLQGLGLPSTALLALLCSGRLWGTERQRERIAQPAAAHRGCLAHR